jgi:hypothetical protein
MTPKIFIGIVTYAKDAHALPTLLESIKQFTFAELHFIDTTEVTAPGLAPYGPHLTQEVKNRLPGRQVHIEKYRPLHEQEVPFEVIAHARNELRKQFLASDCTHLFFMDDDMGFPADTLTLLLSHDAPVAVGVYINNLRLREDITRLAPIGYIKDPVEHDKVRPLMLVDVVPPRIIRVVLSGFGCALLKREVLEQVEIKYQAGTTEDTPFYLELDKRDILVVMDTRVKCKHLKYPLGDPRNRYLDFANYELQIRQKPAP